jgi:hypothetical protein
MKMTRSIPRTVYDWFDEINVSARLALDLVDDQEAQELLNYCEGHLINQGSLSSRTRTASP